MLAGCGSTATTPPAAPVGLTAIALDGKVGLSWKAVDRGVGYAVYRGTSAGSISQKVSSAGLTGTSFTDTSAANGQAYHYAVRATNSAGESASGAQTATSTPRARSCATGNAVVVENCFPGTTDWKTMGGAGTFNNGVEGYATASSVNAGGSVEMRTATDFGAAYRIEIYRTGWYGGNQGRLVSVIPALEGVRPPACLSEPSTTGLFDCGHWGRSATLTTGSDWPSGTYLLKLVRRTRGPGRDPARRSRRRQ